jgi:hypothetical protein
LNIIVVEFLGAISPNYLIAIELLSILTYIC